MHLRTVLLCGVLTAVPTWFMAPIVGDGVWLLAFVLLACAAGVCAPFIAGMRLQRW